MLVLLNVIRYIEYNVLELDNYRIVEVLFHRRKLLDISSNGSILNANIDFLLKSERFDERCF